MHADATERPTPAAALEVLLEGNRCFVAGRPRHPNQGTLDRARVASEQHPKAVVFGCSDSRVAAELVFDQGLGDLFVVRTAGHVVDSSTLGSIEYALDVLAVPLVLVLGHRGCGAVRAGVDTLTDAIVPSGYIRTVVEQVTLSILAGRNEGLTEIREFETYHVEETCRLLRTRSRLVARAVADGSVEVVGATYDLNEGQVQLCPRSSAVDSGAV